jgi:molybdopterin synthase sulfur carrier subunit
MATLLLFAAAREAAGESRIDITGASVSEVLEQAKTRFGERFSMILQHSSVFVDGEPQTHETAVDASSEIAVLPPVSGG